MMNNVDACKAVIVSQAAKGLSKYLVPLERSGVTVSGMANHGKQEAADLLAYLVELERLAVELETELARVTPLLELVRRIPASITGDWPTEVRREMAAMDAAK